MDKIIELIIEEARRRSGKGLVSRIYDVELEVRMELMRVMEGLNNPEKEPYPVYHLKREGDDDTRP